MNETTRIIVYLSAMRFMLIAFSVILLAACSGTVSQRTPTAVSRPLSSATVALTQNTQTPAATQPPANPSPTNPPTPSLQPSLVPSPTTENTSEPQSVTRLPDPAGYIWQTVTSGLNAPVGITSAGDGSGRLFILEQPGVIRILQNDTLAPAPFLDIRDRVGSSGSEQGLLGLAFHPRYTENGYFYINYTDLNGNTVIARFTVSADNPDRADPNSEARLLAVQQPYPNHNGGMLAFGPDGFLYLGLGDGGSGGDPLGNGQSLNTLLGKILRIDVDGGTPYAIPPNNPFVNEAGKKPEIWAYGLRNPWRFSFDPQTDDLYIGDVGQNLWEEIDYLPAGSPGGANFGWNYFEGLHPYDNRAAPASLSTVQPVAEYGHDQGCSVTGGVVYRGSSLPEWQGVYLYGDYCSGNTWGLLRDVQGSWKNALLFENTGRITSFGQDEQGEVYLVDHTGNIARLARK